MILVLGVTILYGLIISTVRQMKLGLQNLNDSLHAGGYGTLPELLEVITWAQLGIHDKPVSSFLEFMNKINGN